MIRHFLAYGNADQASFRHPGVQQSFDYMTLPGTIAAYYAEATAAFALELALDYMIDPRTPLFQGYIPDPKKSHYSLADWHGQAVLDRMGDPETGEAAEFDARLFTAEVVTEMFASVVQRQRGYGEQAGSLQPRMERYARLRLLAQGRSEEEAAQEATQPVEGKPPSIILAPYFATNTSDAWMSINQEIWRQCATNHDVSPVLAVTEIGRLREMLTLLPQEIRAPVAFWVTGFDERRSSSGRLIALREAVATSDRELINLYGGFFSICLSAMGLWGFNNGLGYSEARNWPDLPVTGAAPPRYYVRGLHAFLTPALAQVLVSEEPSLACNCSVCSESSNVAALSYQQLKTHFALARRWEIELVDSRTVPEIVGHLAEAGELAESAREKMPARLASQVRTDYLGEWSEALS